MNLSRPARTKKQPAYAKDHMELNSGEIQRVEKCATKMPKSQIYPSYSKLLLSFVNKVNEAYRNQNSQSEREKHYKTHQLFKNDGPKQKEIILNRSEFKKENSLSAAQKFETNSGRAISDKKIEKTKPIKKQKGAEKEKISPGNSVCSSTKTLDEKKGSENRFKTFKRSSYHIGIAYSIYLQRIKDKIAEIKDPRIIDPTYMAHKLKLESMQAM